MVDIIPLCQESPIQNLNPANDNCPLESLNGYVNVWKEIFSKAHTHN